MFSIEWITIKYRQQITQPNFFTCTKPSETFPHMPVTKRRIIISKSENEYDSNSNADSEANIDHDS